MKNYLIQLKYTLRVVVLLMVITTVSCTKDPDLSSSSDGVLAEYGGDNRLVLAHDITSHLPVGELVVGLYADGVVSVVEASHTLENFDAESSLNSVITFAGQLRQNKYQVQFAEYYDEDNVAVRKHLGTTLTVGADDNITFPDSLNTTYYLFGEGTMGSPFQVNSIYAFDQLSADIDNGLPTAGIYFEMNDDVLMDPTFENFYGVSCDPSKPFEGIFNGNGYTIYNLIIERSTEYTQTDIDGTAFPVGLFNYIEGAAIHDVNIDSPRISGYMGVGALVGAVMNNAGSDMCHSSIDRCSISSSSSVTRSSIIGQMYVGGLVGMVNNNAGLTMLNCSASMADSRSLDILKSDVAAQYFGGLVGGAGYPSKVSFDSCTNNSTINVACQSGVGGLIGASDSLHMSQCTNTGDITTRSDTFATGGLAGGGNLISIVSITNSGNVSGGAHSGGVIGSTLLGNDGESDLYGTINGCSIINSGNVSGYEMVGGVVGASLICVSDVLNSGDIICNDSYAGGITGYASIVSAINCHNTGAIYGYADCGGLVGYGDLFVVGSSTNCGTVTTKGDGYSVGGLIGATGSVGAINYSDNYGNISGANSHAGGLVGHLGYDESANTAKFLICAAVTVVTAFIGGGFELAEVLKVGGSIVENGIIAMKIVEGVIIAAYACDAGFEIAETYEEEYEASEKIEEFKVQLESRCSEIKNTIAQSVTEAVSKMTYQGYIPADSKVLQYSCNSITDFSTYLSTGTNADEYNEALFEDLEEIEEGDAKSEQGIRIAMAVVKAAVGAVLLGFSIATGGVGGIVISATAAVVDISIDAGLTYGLPNDENTIAVSQCSNYGYISGGDDDEGNGLIGNNGDRVVIRDCVTAGHPLKYQIADQTSDQFRDTQHILSVGYGHSVSADEVTYGTYGVVYNGYYSEVFAEKELYSNCGFDIEGDAPLWNIVSDAPFAQPYSNCYAKEFKPSTNKYE